LNKKVIKKEEEMTPNDVLNTLLASADRRLIGLRSALASEDPQFLEMVHQNGDELERVYDASPEVEEEKLRSARRYEDLVATLADFTGRPASVLIVHTRADWFLIFLDSESLDILGVLTRGQL
jgi:hypothetical protein